MCIRIYRDIHIHMLFVCMNIYIFIEMQVHS